MSSNILLIVFVSALAASVPLVAGQCANCSGPKSSWKDSYSIDGKCYCETTFDHKIGEYMVTDTSTDEEITVRVACSRVGSGPSGNRVYYNDIQCGNGPINDAGDEEWCPGRVDLGTDNQEGCRTIGPKWSFPGAVDKPTPEPEEQETPALQQIEEPSLFVEEEEEAPGMLTGLTVTDMADGSSSPLGDSIKVSVYSGGFNLRATVADSTQIEDVVFTSSDGQSRTERHENYDMFGSTGSWPSADGLVGRTVVVKVVATMKDGTSETLEENIDFE